MRSPSMATPIDFVALLKAERQRARSARSTTCENGVGKESTITPPSPSDEGAATPEREYCLPAREDRQQLGLAQHVSCGVESVQHIAGWLSAEEEEELIKCVDASPHAAWTKLRGRRLQSLGGLPRAPPEMMTREPLPAWVESVCKELMRSGVFPADAPPNHVLLNEYQPGQGIDAHRDGPLYSPNVAILSLNSHASFHFVEDSVARAPLAKLLIPPRGLLVFSGDAYERHLHTVPASASDDLTQPCLVRLDGGADAPMAVATAGMAPRARRLSLTVRHVIHSRTPEQQREAGRAALAEPLPPWAANQRLAR